MWSSQVPEWLPAAFGAPAGNLIADMSRAGAIEGSPYESPFHVIHDDDGSAEKLEILERLTDVGFAMAQFLDDTRSSWLLKAEALSHCCLALGLKSPQPVFAAPAGLPALTWARLEALCCLSNQGWQLQFLSSREEKGSMMPLKLTQRSSDDKVICVYRGDLKQHYLTCLSLFSRPRNPCVGSQKSYNVSKQPRIMLSCWACKQRSSSSYLCQIQRKDMPTCSSKHKKQKMLF